MPVACCLQLVTRQVELRAGLDDTTASHCLWFKSDPVKILPFLVNHRSSSRSAGMHACWTVPTVQWQSMLAPLASAHCPCTQVCGYNIRGIAGVVADLDTPPLSITKADSQWIQELTGLLNDQEEKPVLPKVME